jgi:hypothetical protein
MKAGKINFQIKFFYQRKNLISHIRLTMPFCKLIILAGDTQCLQFVSLSVFIFAISFSFSFLLAEEEENILFSTKGKSPTYSKVKYDKYGKRKSISLYQSRTRQ